MRRPILLSLAGLGAIWIGACAILFGGPPTESSPPPHADAGVVLSGGLNARLDSALALMRRRVAPVLAISGVFHHGRWKKAEELCRGEFHVRYRVLCFDPHPYSTRGEAETIARLARAHKWTRVVVVTSRFHVTRARMLVRRCYRGSLWVVGTSSPRWEIPQEWVSETGKLLVQLTVERGC